MSPHHRDDTDIKGNDGDFSSRPTSDKAISPHGSFRLCSGKGHYKDLIAKFASCAAVL